MRVGCAGDRSAGTPGETAGDDLIVVNLTCSDDYYLAISPRF